MGTGVQVFTEEEADGFSFDVLDATKLIPEERVPVRKIGRMVLNRNPDNFFAETEQVAFGTANMIPGIYTSNDPLLAGRHHSYLDTQLSRLGGPNFHEIPINSPVAQVHNNQRDGIHRQAIPRGRVAYEPNSLGGGCPYQAGMRGFVSFPQPVMEDKVRGKPEKFADHYTQATLFFESQTDVEKKHIVGAFRFELTKVGVQAIRERVISTLANVSAELAQGVADGLGIPVPAAMRKVLESPNAPEVTVSPALSLTARPGDGSVRGMKVALLVADGIDGATLRSAHAALAAKGAAPRFVGARLGRVQPASGDAIHVEVSMEAAPAVVWDAVVVPGGDAALAALGQAQDFVKEQYRHCKPILVLGSPSALIEKVALPATLPDGSADGGLVMAGGSGSSSADALVASFVAALAKRRFYERETDPQRV